MHLLSQGYDLNFILVSLFFGKLEPPTKEEGRYGQFISGREKSEFQQQHQQKCYYYKVLIHYVVKILLMMTMQFYVTSVKHSSTLNSVILFILNKYIFKVAMSHSIAFLVPMRSLHLII